MMKKIILVITLIFVFFILILEWQLGYLQYVYETHCIKREFSKSENIVCITEMISQKDFKACYDIYFTSSSNTNYVISHVQIKNGEIVFYKLHKINKDFGCADECKTKATTLRDVLKNLHDNEASDWTID